MPPVLRFLFASQLNGLYARAKPARHGPVLADLPAQIQMELEIDPEDMARIPPTGPVAAVSNHPFGILDAAMLAAALLRVRPDVKILAHPLLGSISGLAPHCILGAWPGKQSPDQTGSEGFKQAILHLQKGGLLILFPSGEVTQWQFRPAGISDPWSEATASLIRTTRATTLPMLCVGRNSVPFHLLGMIHPLLRTTRQPREIPNKAGKPMAVRIGHPISPERMDGIPGDAQATSYLRWRTYLLASRAEPGMHPFPLPALPALLKKKQQIIPPAAPRESMAAEIAALGEQTKLDENREFALFAVQADQAPVSMTEIGRLRETTFRQAGEGTGKKLDLDHFDSYYTHLVLWSKAKQEIAGAYRLVRTPEVLRSRGAQGLYTSTLFNYSPGFFEELGPAAELGRSFITAAYQKQFAPLLMLWKGIVRYSVLHLKTPVLFGAVSISGKYNRASRELMVRFFGSQSGHRLAQLVRPRRPFRARLPHDWELSARNALLGLNELSASIAEIEEDGKGVPVLLKQYLKMNGTVLAFSVDKNFSNALDGLIMVDLRKADPLRLQTYIDKEPLAAFLQEQKNIGRRQLRENRL